MKENGVDLIEVVDNGSGISTSNFKNLCKFHNERLGWILGKPHSTSKLSDIDDFNFLTTFGFRGEALNALSALG